MLRLLELSKCRLKSSLCRVTESAIEAIRLAQHHAPIGVDQINPPRIFARRKEDSELAFADERYCFRNQSFKTSHGDAHAIG